MLIKSRMRTLCCRTDANWWATSTAADHLAAEPNARLSYATEVSPARRRRRKPATTLTPTSSLAAPLLPPRLTNLYWRTVSTRRLNWLSGCNLTRCTNWIMATSSTGHFDVKFHKNLAFRYKYEFGILVLKDIWVNFKIRAHPSDPTGSTDVVKKRDIRV